MSPIPTRSPHKLPRNSIRSLSSLYRPRPNADMTKNTVPTRMTPDAVAFAVENGSKYVASGMTSVKKIYSKNFRSPIAVIMDAMPHVMATNARTYRFPSGSSPFCPMRNADTPKTHNAHATRTITVMHGQDVRLTGYPTLASRSLRIIAAMDA